MAVGSEAVHQGGRGLSLAGACEGDVLEPHRKAGGVSAPGGGSDGILAAAQRFHGVAVEGGHLGEAVEPGVNEEVVGMHRAGDVDGRLGRSARRCRVGAAEGEGLEVDSVGDAALVPGGG
ncbi:MAG: hypothetical protein ACKV2O_08505 [Acidimicrobiales bacterium]